jgi:hypothetical protein
LGYSLSKIEPHFRKNGASKWYKEITLKKCAPKLLLTISLKSERFG